VPRFLLLTDAHIRQQLVDGLQERVWDVERAIDVFPEGTDDVILFEYAAKNNRVFVTCDKKLRRLSVAR
jgi:predicted nuclease of predicted toxin-antitoxin system